MVYISSPSIATSSRLSLMQAQSDLATTQKELTSNALADPGLALGGRSARLVSLSVQQNRLQTITDTNSVATTRLTATNAALDTLRTAATSFLSTLTTASTAGGSSSLASGAKSALSALTGALNTSVGGDYIFAGINTDTQPSTAYVQSPASANKQAVDTAFSATFGTSQNSAAAASISGAAMQSFLDGPFASLFSAGAYGTTWSSASDQVITSQISAGETAQTSVGANQEPFRQLAQAYAMVTEFGGGTLSADATKAAVASASALVTKAISGLTNVQAGVGITQSSIATANDSMAAQITLLSTQSGDLDGVDTYALSVKLSSLQTQIQASYELTSKLQQMSLVNFLT